MLSAVRPRSCHLSQSRDKKGQDVVRQFESRCLQGQRKLLEACPLVQARLFASGNSPSALHAPLLLQAEGRMPSQAVRGVLLRGRR